MEGGQALTAGRNLAIYEGFLLIARIRSIVDGRLGSPYSRCGTLERRFACRFGEAYTPTWRDLEGCGDE